MDLPKDNIPPTGVLPYSTADGAGRASGIPVDGGGNPFMLFYAANSYLPGAMPRTHVVPPAPSTTSFINQYNENQGLPYAKNTEDYRFPFMAGNTIRRYMIRDGLFSDIYSVNTGGKNKENYSESCACNTKNEMLKNYF